MIHNIATLIACAISGLALISVCGCDEHVIDLPNEAVSHSAGNQTNEGTSDDDQESVSEVRAVRSMPPQTDGAEKPLTVSEGAIKPLLPRPIQTEEEVRVCMAAALEFDRSTREFVAESKGVPLETLSTPITKVLKDCVVQYDAERRGCTKFYPGDTRVPIYLRDTDVGDVGDANVFIANCDSAVVHVTMDWRLHSPGEGQMRIRCSDPNTGRQAEVTLHVDAPIWSSDPPHFTFSDWSEISEPEKLLSYCIGLYDDFVQLRGR